MQKIDFEDLPSRRTPINGTNLNLVQTNAENAINEAKEAVLNVELIAVDSVAPEECVEGDKYFNTTTNLIYTATDTDTWSSTGESPIEGIFYIVFEEQTTYAYDGTTLISVGGGAGGGGDNEPIGKVVPMVLETAPDGYLLCDGSIYTKTAYPDLYKALIGTIYQLDDVEFQVPNIQGKVIVGKKSDDSDFAFIGRDGGEKKHQLSVNEMPSHDHIVNVFYGPSGGGNHFYINESGVTNADTIHQVGYTSSNGGNQAHNNLQPYTTLNYFIKAQKLSGDIVLSEDIKIGTIFQWSGSTAPTNYMICDGSAISRTNYANLFSIIGTTYGNGDGSTTFNLPDFRGNVAVGYKSGDSDFGTLGGTGGSKYLQEHSHTIPVRVGNVGGWTTPLGGDGAGQYTLDTANAGTGDSGNLQPYQVVNYIIKVSGTTQLSAQVVNTHNTSDSDTYSCNYVNNKLGEVIYSSTSGTSGNITLDKSVADYDEIEIYYHSADNIYGNTGRIPNANNKRIALSAPFNIDAVCYNKYGIIVISNKNLTYYSQFETHIWSGNNGINTGTYFYIDKVVGYK